MSVETDSPTNHEAPCTRPSAEILRRFRDAIGLVSLGILAIGVASLGLHNLGNRYFWTDESSSFFTALGWPAPGQQPGDLAAIQETLVTFLDPGLYHLVTRGWSELFGTSIESLRSLPFMFFILYVVALLLWYRRFHLPWVVASAGVSIMMLDNITPYYALEVRAYSASLAAAVVLPLVALWFIDRPSGIRLLGFLGVGLFLGAMQYMTVSVNLATAVLLAVGAARSKATWAKRNIALAALIMTVWLPFIYLATRGWPSGGAEQDLDHVRTTVLAYMDAPAVFQTLATNFFSLTALPRTLFLILIPVLFVIARLSGRSELTRRVVGQPAREIVVVWLYVLALTASAAVVSMGGFLPWVLGTRWSITEIAGIALSVLGMFVLARQYVPINIKQMPILASVAAIALMMVTAVGATRLWMYERPGDSQALDELVPVLVSGNPDVPILVDYWIFPDTRYWVEYSGEFDPWRQAWIERGVVSTDGFVKAGPEAIEEFIDSSSQFMLLKDSEALNALSKPLPDNIEVIYPSDPDFASPGLLSAPLVLGKTDARRESSS